MSNPFRSHLCSWDWKFLILSCIWKSGSTLIGSQAASITSLHLFSPVHMALKKNLIFCSFAFLGFLRNKASKQWLDIDIKTWWTLASRYASIRLSFATTLSNMMSVYCSPRRLLHQVYFWPMKPKSYSPHKCKQFLKSSICLASQSIQPSLSLRWLKSPKTTHGKSHRFFKDSKSSQDMYLLPVSGWP